MIDIIIIGIIGLGFFIDSLQLNLERWDKLNFQNFIIELEEEDIILALNQDTVILNNN